MFDISNEAIFNGILPKLGVYRRTAEGVRADFFVYDSSGEQLLADEFGAEIVITDKKQRQISLPAAMTDTSVDVIETLSAGASNILTTPNATPIRVGLYSLLVIVTFEGKIVKQHKLFTIGENPDGTYWVNTP